MKGTIRTQQNAQLLHPVHDFGSLIRCRFPRLACQFEPQEQAMPAHVADQRMPPVSSAFSCNPSSRIASSTAKPTAHETGFPPNVLKYSIPLAKDAAISGVVITAPIGWPLPIGFPRVTMSGTTPCVSNIQKCEPARPNPVCTSSATQTPPAARTVW